MTIYCEPTKFHGQLEVSVSQASDHPAIRLTRPPVRGRAVREEDPGEHRVAVLSAALLQAVMSTLGEDISGLALRAGVTTEMVAGAASGTCPAWALPYAEFTALADAAAAVWPGDAFETAAACDLLVSCVLNGDQAMATDVLTQPRSHCLARALLRLVITGNPGSPARRAGGALLPEDLLALLSERAAALAGSESSDAWVGLEILGLHQNAVMTGQPRRASRAGAESPEGNAARFWNGRIDANGTAWRMRSLAAMGHDATRIARALNVAPDLVRRLIRGNCQTVTTGFHLLACQLWDAWWDMRPPERNAAERQAASRARQQARSQDWPAAAGLDEDLLDSPGYRPACHYHPATGTGTAAGFDPYRIRHPGTRNIA
jgi:hypothetical protein